MGLSFAKGRICFNRQEFAGSFGDIGTDFPLIVSLILVCGLDPASVLTMFGLMLILTGTIYKIPMPVQPLKAMAVIALTQKLSGNVLYGGGLAIGLVMLFLSASGLINWIARIVPTTVVRGIQFGLGMQLATLALKEYVPSAGISGYLLALISFVLVVSCLENKRYPAALLIIGLGLIYALVMKVKMGALIQGIGVRLPQPYVPSSQDIVTGFFMLAIPQLCLSVGNSILATKQIVQDLFPEQKLTVNKISFTYSLMNIIAPFFSGIPVCHGSGGIAGHYTFGARTGGSVIIYGGLYIVLGVFLSGSFQEVIQLFPRPILGIILFFEGLALIKLLGHLQNS